MSISAVKAVWGWGKQKFHSVVDKLERTLVPDDSLPIRTRTSSTDHVTSSPKLYRSAPPCDDGSFPRVLEEVALNPLPVGAETPPAMRKVLQDASMLVVDEKITPLFKFALREIFKRFDVDRDGMLNPNELAEYHAAAIADDLDEDSYRWYLRHADCDNQGSMPEEGFSKMFTYLVGHAAADVWEALSNLGYNKTLRLQDYWTRLISDGSLTVTMQTVVTSLFESYDADNDGVWTSADIRAFFEVCEGGKASTDFLLYLQRRECMTIGPSMRLQHLLRMFYLLSARDPTDVYTRLERFGFDNNLQRRARSHPRMSTGSTPPASPDKTHPLTPSLQRKLSNASMRSSMPSSVLPDTTGLELEQQQQPTVDGASSLLLAGQPTERFGMVINEIFDRFDADGDDALSFRELHGFKVTYTNRPLDDESLQWLRTNFEHNSEQALTRQGFIDFHVYLAQTAPSDVWNELRMFGYDRSLQRLAGDSDGSHRGVVVRSFKATREGELTLVRNDIVVVTGARPHGWLAGDCHGQSGLFPATCIVLISSINESALRGRVCIARTVYPATCDEELSFLTGDAIVIAGIHESGWWLGCLGETLNSYTEPRLFPPECTQLREVARPPTGAAKKPRSMSRNSYSSAGPLSRHASSPSPLMSHSPMTDPSMSPVLHPSLPTSSSVGRIIGGMGYMSADVLITSPPSPQGSPKYRTSRRLSTGKERPDSSMSNSSRLGDDSSDSELEGGKRYNALTVMRGQRELFSAVSSRPPRPSSRMSSSLSDSNSDEREERRRSRQLESDLSPSKSKKSASRKQSQRVISSVTESSSSSSPKPTVYMVAKSMYVAEDASQLTLRPGDVVQVLGEYDAGFYFGEHNGKRGLFPQSVVRLHIDRTEDVVQEVEQLKKSAVQARMRQALEDTHVRLQRQLSDITGVVTEELQRLEMQIGSMQ